jgi:hypothetical protein
MAIGAAVGSEVLESRKTKSNYDHRFFLGMTILIAVIVFIGFARTYYLAGVFHPRPLPSVIVHVHGAVATCWILLLVVQASLISGHHQTAHRRLGIFGFFVAVSMILLGVLAARESILIQGRKAPGFDALSFFAIPFSEIVGFAGPVMFAFAMRRKASVHKRLILIGTIAMMTAALGRWPVAFLLHKPLPAMLCSYSLLAILALYDLFSTRRLQPVTILGSAFVILVELMSYPVGPTAAWHIFASWLRSPHLP